MGNVYLKIPIKKYKNINDLLNEKDPSFSLSYRIGSSLSFDELLDLKRFFVVGEPGYGKTRLLKEFSKQNIILGKKVIFLDLKKISGDIAKHIIENQKTIERFSDKAYLKKSASFKTDDFQLKNTPEVLVVLDALDEVAYQQFPSVIDSIKKLMSKFGKIGVVVSCRKHHCLKNRELLLDIESDFLELFPFSRDEVKEYLSSNKFSDQAIEAISKTFEVRYRDLVIQTPRYLEMLVENIKEFGLKGANISRTELFESFIYKKLEIEEKKRGSQKKEMIKRTLEKIALIMEMQQKNVLKKDDLMTILDDVSSNLALTFLSQVPLEDLYERTVLKDNIDFVEFENTEFQEYLAAKEITRLGMLDQVAFDLVVDQYSKEIFPSWFNTLGFIVDLNPKILKQIIQYGMASERITKDEEYFRFLTHIDPNKLTVADKVEIFVGVFNYYNEVSHWIPPDICRNLSYYFDSSITSTLKEAYEDTCKSGDKGFIKKGNLAYVVGFLIERKVFQKSEILFWRNILLKYGEDQNGVVQRHVLDALAKIGDMKNIIKLNNLIGKDKLVDERFIDACAKVDPNHPVSIQAFVQGTKNDNIYARYGLYRINKAKGIRVFLKTLAEDKLFLTEFIDRESIYNGKDVVLIETLEKYWDASMKNEVKKILKTAFSESNWYDSQRSKFLKQLLSLTGRKENDFIYEVLKEIESDMVLQGHLFGFEEIFKCLLTVGNVKGFVEIIKKFNWGSQIACSTLLSFHKDKDNRIYKMGRKFFKNEYESFEQRLKKNIEKNADEKEKERILTKFRELSEPSPGKYSPQVFRFYLDNNKKFDLDKKDKARLIKLLIGSIFKKIDPRKATVKWNEEGKTSGARTYTITSSVHIYGDCLAVAADLKLNVQAYRKQIIAYIPFSYSQHLKSIFELVHNITPQEAKVLLSIYTQKRDDDLVTFMPSSFIESCEKYGISDAIPVLKEFVNNEKLSMYDRRTSLKVICDLEPDQVYLSSIFKKYSGAKETSEIAEIANEYLMTAFNDKKSIEWRFKEIKERCFSYIEPTGPHFVAVETHVTELHDKKFAGPIMNLTKADHIDFALDLLDFSFDLMKKGEPYQSYVMYVWEIVMKYFDNLKEHRIFNYYKRLEDHVRKNSHREGVNWFTIRLQGLLRSYLEFMGKPKDISDCIKKYNVIKANQYLDVTRVEDLVEIAKDVFNNDVRKVIENEGIYKVIQQSAGIQEVLIQKTLVPYIEAAFLRKGFRQNEVKVIREAQSPDDKRTDFLIFYGFWGPLVVEVKRSDNKEVFQKSERKAYKSKLLHYIAISKASYGFFLIFQINDKKPLEKVMPALRQEYKDCKNIFISEFNCLLAPNL